MNSDAQKQMFVGGFNAALVKRSDRPLSLGFCLLVTEARVIGIPVIVL